ncbi:MAG: hydroxyethylthiazole kinase [Bifidobacteriaceae bacterium]|jgi:hydroxyethylthiazole kinase|nr:hydroxyethylthiazole kinase [Bifidobacteriaceae bacterium]MCI1914711.1 hydroxyethylthiazole kinase [Bifidobacteriaceae bacterium]
MTLHTQSADSTSAAATEKPNASDIGEALVTLRATAPLTQCITNEVTTNFVANAILAVGGSPAMAADPGEADDFVRLASALLINVGTLSTDKRVTIPPTARIAHETGTPWVLDPVAVGALQPRTRIVEFILDFRPTVIRGNASEIIALAGGTSAGKGVDSGDDPVAALPAALALAARYGSVVAISGATDLITDGRIVARTPGGSVLSTRITGAGCSLGGVTASFAAAASSPLVGALAASIAYNVAAERAEKISQGPGTYQPHFLDELYSLSPADIGDPRRFSLEPVDPASAQAAGVSLVSQKGAAE